MSRYLITPINRKTRGEVANGSRVSDRFEIRPSPTGETNVGRLLATELERRHLRYGERDPFKQTPERKLMLAIVVQAVLDLMGTRVNSKGRRVPSNDAVNAYHWLFSGLSNWHFAAAGLDPKEARELIERTLQINHNFVEVNLMARPRPKRRKSKNSRRVARPVGNSDE